MTASPDMQELAREIVEASFQSRAKTTLMELLILRFSEALQEMYQKGVEDSYEKVLTADPLLTETDWEDTETLAHAIRNYMAEKIRDLLKERSQ